MQICRDILHKKLKIIGRKTEECAVIFITD